MDDENEEKVISIRIGKPEERTYERTLTANDRRYNPNAGRCRQAANLPGTSFTRHRAGGSLGSFYCRCGHLQGIGNKGGKNILDRGDSNSISESVCLRGHRCLVTRAPGHFTFGFPLRIAKIADSAGGAFLPSIEDFLARLKQVVLIRDTTPDKIV